MERRQFLKLASLAGLSVVAPLGVRKVHADPAPNGYAGKFFIMVNAGGGWDPTFACDPKGGDIDHPYMPGDIKSAGNIPYAPIKYDGLKYSNQQFFEKYSNQLVVLNGIDTTTNNHDTGSRITWSGKLDEGYPSLSALIAGALAPSLPTAFISNGGYDFTADVVPLTRVNDVGAIQRIAYPNRFDPNDEKKIIHSNEIAGLISAAQSDRLKAMRAATTLPTYSLPMGQLFLTRTGGNDLQRMTQYLPTGDQLNNSNGIERQARIAFAAYQAGIAVSANIDSGGFDTHGDHDNRQADAMGHLLQGVDSLMNVATQLGIDQQIVVLIGSDFGRTPSYNMTNGKDHWTITSMMMMGGGIPGNRVLGATDGKFQAMAVDGNGSPSMSAGAKAISPAAIHRALRVYAGVDGSDIAKRFPITQDPLNFLM